jgi:hypothetical protein
VGETGSETSVLTVDVYRQEVSKLFAPHPAKRFEPGEHNYLFVELASVEEAQRAMDSLNGVDGPWGGPLRVQRARGEQVAK